LAAPGGETGLDPRSRRLAALRRFAAEQRDRPIGVSSGGAMVRQSMKHASPPSGPLAKTRKPALHISRCEMVADRLAVLTEESTS
jgi:hypothetical protein